MDHEAWNRRYAGRACAWSRAPNALVAAETRALAPGRALDLGAGEGRNALWLAEHGWRVTAIDFSEVALERARRLSIERGVEVDWVLEDLLRYRPAPEAFDLVLVCYLQLPAPERRTVLARARAALAPGGALLYVGHDLSNLAHGAGGPRDPAVLATPEEVARELAGLAIERAEVVTREVEADAGHGGAPGARALDAVVRARRQG